MVVIICVAVVLLLAVVFVVYASQKSVLPTKKVDTLGMREILAFFKEEETIKKLQANENYIAVAIKEETNVKTFKIVATVFDKETNSIVAPLFVWLAKSLAEDLQEAFGNKQMLILQ